MQLLIVASSAAPLVRELQTFVCDKLNTRLCGCTYQLMGLSLVALCQSWKWCSEKWISGEVSDEFEQRRTI